MFQTIYEVVKKDGDSTDFTALFLERKDAEKFAEKTVKSIDDDFIFSKRHYLDGSFLNAWTGEHHEVYLDDNPYITDYRNNTILLQPLGLEFANMDELNDFINRNHERIGIS